MRASNARQHRATPQNHANRNVGCVLKQRCSSAAEHVKDAEKSENRHSAAEKPARRVFLIKK
jgi:hypothetical protein